jgi:hypothetical protein
VVRLGRFRSLSKAVAAGLRPHRFHRMLVFARHRWQSWPHPAFTNARADAWQVAPSSEPKVISRFAVAAEGPHIEAFDLEVAP